MANSNKNTPTKKDYKKLVDYSYKTKAELFHAITQYLLSDNKGGGFGVIRIKDTGGFP